MPLVSRCSIFSESFPESRGQFHMFDVFGASGESSNPKLHVFIWSICYEQFWFNKSRSVEEKGMIDIKYTFSQSLVATCQALQASCSPTREAQPPCSATACEEGLVALPHDATSQRVIFKSSSAFPKILWTRHHSFAIRSLDATWCNYLCNARHAPRSTPFALPFNDIIPATVPQTKHTQICAQLYVHVLFALKIIILEGFKSFNASNFKPLTRCQVCQESSSSAPPSSSHSFCNLSSFVVFSMSPSKNALKRCFGKVCQKCMSHVSGIHVCSNIETWAVEVEVHYPLWNNLKAILAIWSWFGVSSLYYLYLLKTEKAWRCREKGACVNRNNME